MAAAGGKDIVGSLAKFISEFNSQLASSKTGSLAQIWMPEAGEDGGVVLNTQGLPYSINGVGDLLALFRCISCKYKFSTDVTKTHAMGAVGRVFTSGEVEMSGHVQRYDQHVYLRAAEAQRCRVHSTLFMPIYASPARDACLAVFEVVLTDQDVNFAGMVGWIISCLQSEGLYTAEVDTASMQHQRMGLRTLGPTDYDGVSALESGVAPRQPLGPGGMPRVLEDGVSERAAPGGGTTSLDLLAGGAAAAAAAAAVRAAEGETRGSGGGSGGSDGQHAAKRPRTEGGSSGGGAREEGGERQRLQRVTSGPEGMPSPAPQQAPMGANVSGSGGGSGPAAGTQQQAAPPPPLQPAGHRLSGPLPPLHTSASLPGLLNGSGHHSGSGGGLPSGSTAQAGQPPDPTPLVPIVAAAVQQLLSQGSPNPQLAALLGGVTPPMPPPLAPPLAQPFGAPGSSSGLPASLLNGALGGGPSPGVTGAQLHAQHAAQAQQQAQDGGEGGDEDEETDDERAFLRPAPGAAQKYGQGNRVLTYDDLAAQFGYGLKEAAARLNICPTTLKRACRRLGIPRWPRRELVKHKKARQATRADGGNGGGGGGSAAAGAPNGHANGSLNKGQGFSTGSGPSSGGSGNPQMMLAAAAAAAAAATQSQLQRPASSSLLSGLGLQGMEQLLPLQGGADLAAAIAGGLQQQGQGQGGGGPANPALVSQVLQQLLVQHQQQGQQPQGQQANGGGPGGPAWQSGGLPPLHAGGPQRAGSLPQPLGGSQPLPALQGLGGGPMNGGALHGGGHALPRISPGPPVPLLSNLGLPRRADSKLQSLGPGMGSLDILAAADLDVSVGNMSVGNSPRLALSNLGGLSQLGLSAFDFGGTVAGGGGGPAATATGGGGGATGPQNDPAFSTGAMPPRAPEK